MGGHPSRSLEPSVALGPYVGSTMPAMNRDTIRGLFDWRAWDRWLPLGTVAVFTVIGAAVLAAGITFGIPEGDYSIEGQT